MHFLVLQRYTFYKLNFDIEILSLRYSIKSQLIFQTLAFQATLTLGMSSYNVNV